MDAATTVQTPKPAGGRPRIWTPDFVLVCVTTALYFIGYYMFLPTLPVYLTSRGISKTDIGLIIGAFTVSAALSRPIIGFLFDRGLSKWVMMAGAAGSTVVAVVISLLSSVVGFAGLRLFQGAAFASFTTSVNAFAASVIPSSRRGEAMGYFTMSNSLGISAGPIIGTFLMERYGFTGVSVPAAAIAAVCVVLTMRFSSPGAVHVAGQQVKMALFNKHALQPTVVAFSSSVAWGGIISFLPLFVYERQLGSAGTFFTVYAVVQLLARAVGGRVADRYGRPVCIYSGTVITGASMLLLAVTGSEGVLLLAGVLYGCGIGLAQPAYWALAVDRAPEVERGQAMATVTLGFDIGITLGAILLGPALELGGFPLMFTCAAAAALVGLLAFSVLRWVEHRGAVADRRTIGSATGG